MGGGESVSTPFNKASTSSTVSQESSIMPSVEENIAEMPDASVYAIAGASAGFIAGLVVCPLDVVKTRLQAQGGFSRYGIASEYYYNGLGGTISTIWKTEGIKGFYRGVVPITLGYLPTWMVYFTVYERCKKEFANINAIRDSPFAQHMISALCAGCMSTTATNPIWVVKTRLMTQNAKSSWQYKGTIDAFIKMYKTEGLISFYAGIVPALLGLTHVAVQFPLYEKFKTIFVPPDGPNTSKYRKAGGIIFASSLSKMVASMITYPHEVIRTRMQIQRGFLHGPNVKLDGIINTAVTIFKKEGWRGFYSGLGTNLVRTVPASAVTLITYEMVVEEINKVKFVHGYPTAPV
ncbi:mitochondrial carrier domain-containing protein [Limtongia smithiae]|uniref:mitochondrial carrier domain-containing protein n=1 Tax=Limtongia smithiae TaxID=1125753 RepID=UPI0034CE7639